MASIGQPHLDADAHDPDDDDDDDKDDNDDDLWTWAPEPKKEKARQVEQHPQESVELWVWWEHLTMDRRTADGRQTDGWKDGRTGAGGWHRWVVRMVCWDLG